MSTGIIKVQRMQKLTLQRINVEEDSSVVMTCHKSEQV